MLRVFILIKTEALFAFVWLSVIVMKFGSFLGMFLFYLWSKLFIFSVVIITALEYIIKSILTNQAIYLKCVSVKLDLIFNNITSGYLLSINIRHYKYIPPVISKSCKKWLLLCNNNWIKNVL